MWLFILIIVLLILCYYALNQNYDYWKNRGVPNPPVSYLFGSLGDSLALKKSLGEIYLEIYNFYQTQYVGFFKIRKPGIVVRDIELIKTIVMKDFNSFHDNDIEVNEKVDPLFGKNPFALRGNRWKTVRNQITPCFTSKRLKAMFPLMEEVGKKLTIYLELEPSAVGQSGLEAKELAAKYTTDVVASCAFGIDAKSFVDPKAEFREIGKKMLKPSLKNAITQLTVLLVPSLANILNIKFFPDDVADYFRNVVNSNLQYREQNKIVRHDFLDLMNELKNKLGEGEFTTEDIVAHAASFWGDGFETSSTAIAYILYELGANPHVQRILKQEIDNALEKGNGQLTYDLVQEMQYMDQVFKEGLRKHPPGTFLAKMSTERFTLPPPCGEGFGKEVFLEPGTPVIIPIYAIHHDPKYYPDPERFDPERFNEANVELRQKCTFLGFGEGPRACLGQRFAIVQSKVALVHIVNNFEIRVNSKTMTPLQMDPRSFLLQAKGGIWLNFYKRNK